MVTSIGETDAAVWFIKFWTGPGNGRWLLAHYGVGTVPFNNGLESLWRWMRDKICRNNVVRRVGWCATDVCVHMYVCTDD